jgi:hypothetical protein
MNSNLLVLIIFLSSLAVISNQNNLSDDIKERCNCQGPKAFKKLAD